MSIKQTTSLLVVSVFCSVFSGSIAWSQSNDLRCAEPDSLVETMGHCDDVNAKKKLNVDPAVTNSVKSSVSNSASVNSDDNAASNDNSSSSSNNDGSGADVGDDSDHDNGHGNDADHDDASNPGQGGGNHGADK